MTGRDITDFLGMTIEPVCRNLSKLKVMDAIDLPQGATVLFHSKGILGVLASGEEGAF